MEILLLLAFIGFLVGILGTMIGAGGGFILVPILLIIFPEKTPEEITSISLAFVFFNSISGTLAYHKMKRIDYKSGLIFAASTIPGAILGTIVITMISKNIFNLIFGIILIILAAYLFLKPENKNRNKIANETIQTPPKTQKKWLGVLINLTIGFISTLLGIGGGIMRVPSLVHLLNFPVHMATATSQFIVAIMAFSGIIVHLINGNIVNNLMPVIILSINAIIGAQIGARLSAKVQGSIIIKILSITLTLVGLRMIFTTFF
ncbi:MAG: putative permease [Fusobacteria bacterium]|nr:MAG: putative permease [Fusobacteriota bacterium]KAF0230243.1 MAG: hypothetical protein FD182_633 [Fusobacteriota bacterium]